MIKLNPQRIGPRSVISLAGYGITNLYTKVEIDNLLSSVFIYEGTNFGRIRSQMVSFDMLHYNTHAFEHGLRKRGKILL